MCAFNYSAMTSLFSVQILPNRCAVFMAATRNDAHFPNCFRIVITIIVFVKIFPFGLQQVAFSPHSLQRPGYSR